MNVKNVSLLCLSLVCLFAVSAKIQAQAPTRLTNPTSFPTCGLPTTYANFTSTATVRTFEMTADCTFSNSQVASYFGFLSFTFGTYTINGNGYSITGPTNAYSILVGQSGILNLNNVTIRQAGRPDTEAIRLQQGGRLNATNVIFSNNATGHGVIGTINGDGHIYLENAQFLNNSKGGSDINYGSAVTAATEDSVVVITNGIFRGNSGSPDVIVAAAARSSVRLEGCVIFDSNIHTGVTAANPVGAYSGGTVTDNTINQGDRTRCPQPKRKKKKVPTATPTSRPLATTCIDLNQATGIVVHATYGLGSGVQCQRLGGGGIGFQALADSFIDAVDVWGYVEQGVEVCFPAAGELLFLDAGMMPRAILPLASTVVNGMTCGAIDSPGSIVLMTAVG